MSNSRSKSILQCSKYVKSGFRTHNYNSTRVITGSATAKNHEELELANSKPFKEIPSVAILPFIGSSWAYFPIIGKYNIEKSHKADIDKHKVYGDIVRERFGNFEVVSSFVPEAMEIMYKHEGKYPNKTEFTTLKAYRESRKDWYKTTGVMIMKGKDWHDLRSKIQKHLMKPRAIQAYLQPMQDIAKDFVALIRHKRDINKEVPELIEELHKWGLESIALVGLDTRLGCLNLSQHAESSDGQKLISSVKTIFHCMNKLEAFTGNFQFWRYFPTPTWKKFEKSSDIFTEIAFKYINLSLERLKKQTEEDVEPTLLQSMLMTKGLDLSEAMVSVADMLMAGIDTTSNTVGFLLYDLAKNPEKQNLLFKELNELLPRKEDKITPEIYNELHYLKACLKESLRLHPVVKGNLRSLDHDVAISGYRIPAGTAIVCVLQVIHRNEKYFKNADKFIPERWLEGDRKMINPFAYVPFGIGTRSCIGRRLAEQEAICLSTEIIRNFSVEYHHEDIDMYTRLLNIPDKPLRFNFLDR